MATTLSGLERELSSYIADDLTGTTTSDGNAGGTTLVCSALANKGDNYYNDWWVKITSGTYINAIQQVSGFAQSTGTCTMYVSFGGQIVSGVTFELHQMNPNLKKAGLNAAITDCLENIAIALDDHSLTSNDWLPNGDFEDWASSSNPDHWTLTTLTAAKSTTTLGYGTYSLKLTRAGADGSLACTSTNWSRLRDLAGQTVEFWCWVKASSASQARLSISDGITTTYSPTYHTGGGNWELLKVQGVALDADAASISASLLVTTTSGDVYFDKARLLGPNNYEYRLPSCFAENPRQLLLQTSGDADDIGEMGPLVELHNWQIVEEGTTRWLKLGDALPSNRKMVLRGVQKFTSLTNWTDSIGADKPRTSIICAYALYWIYRSLWANASAQNRTIYNQAMTAWFNVYQQAVRNYAVILPERTLKFRFRC